MATEADPGRAADDLLRGTDPSDPQLRALLRAMRSAGAPPLHELGVEGARERVRGMREHVTPGPAMALVEDVVVPAATGDVPVRRFVPGPGRARGVAVHLHGGGWALGDVDGSDAVCRYLAAWSGWELVGVDYRLAPEHPFPAAVHDADAAVTWAAELAAGRPLAVVGDSAGATLATVAARRARDRGGPAVAAQALVYPVTDHRMATPSYTEHGGALLIGADDMRWFWDLYAPDPADRASADASPGLVDDLAGMPRTLLVVAEHDPLRDEGLAYARRLSDAGVEVTVEHFPTMAHGFFALIGVVDAATDAVRAVADALRSAGGGT